MGAAEVIDYRDQHWVDRVRAVSPDGVNVVVDTHGGNDLTAAVEVLAYRGRIVLMASGPSRPVLPVGDFYVKDATVCGFVISRASLSELAEAAGQVNRLLAGGRLRPRRVRTLPLRAMAQAHAQMEAGQLGGQRLVLVPEHPAG